MSVWAVVVFFAGLCTLVTVNGVATLIGSSPPAMAVTLAGSAFGAWKLAGKDDR